MDYIWSPKGKINYLIFMRVIKLGDQANAGLPAPIKLMRTVLHCSSGLLVPLSWSRRGWGPSGPEALLPEGKEEQQLCCTLWDAAGATGASCLCGWIC